MAVWCGELEDDAVIRTIKYFKVRLRTTKYYHVVLCTTEYYSVLQNTTPYYKVLYSVLQGTTEYKVLQLKYYSVPPSTSPCYKLQLCILQSTTPYYKLQVRTTQYTPYYKALQRITSHRKVLLCTAKYYKVLQTGVTLQHHFLSTPPLTFFEYDSSFPWHSSSNSTRLLIRWIILVFSMQLRGAV